jgi:hypothetical protein
MHSSCMISDDKCKREPLSFMHFFRRFSINAKRDPDRVCIISNGWTDMQMRSPYRLCIDSDDSPERGVGPYRVCIDSDDNTQVQRGTLIVYA